MNKGFLTYLVLLLVAFSLYSCDTKDNVRPRNQNFFYKLYAGDTIGYQVASRIIETTDGGLLLTGTAYNEDGSNEIIIIKTDVGGNLEWRKRTKDIIGSNYDSEAKALLEVPSGYIIGGVFKENNLNRSIIFKVDFDGNFSGNSADSVHVWTNYAGVAYNNWLSDITIGHSGLLISGYTERPFVSGPDLVGGINGFISVYGEDLINDPTIPITIRYLGLDGDDFVSGAFEVRDTVNNIDANSDNTRYLVFGHSIDLNNPTGEFDFFYYGLDKLLLDAPGMTNQTTVITSGSQSSIRAREINDKYWVIGNSDQAEIFVSSWEFNPRTNDVDWQFVQEGTVSLTREDEIGKSIYPLTNGDFVVAGDMLVSAEHTEIVLARADRARNVRNGWPATIGNTSSTYEANDVIVLQDGSIVTLGTADLEPIKKIVVIKTGPNGEMSFE